MIIDNELSWKDQITFVCKKVAHGIGVIIKARKVPSSKSRKCFLLLIYIFVHDMM